MAETELNALVRRRAEEVFEDAAYAEHWLQLPNQALGWHSPLSMQQRPEGLQSVLRELSAVEFGLPI